MKLFQIEQKCTRKGTYGEKGTGVGLILCKEFIEKNGGQLGVTRVLGQGSTFHFMLPRHFKKASTHPEPASKDTRVTGQDVQPLPVYQRQ
jgi:light-regulated signal transduction histidine kinase (bacteriophytochrome)